MNDPLLPPSELPGNGDTDDTLTSSMMSRLITEVIKLRESVNRNSTNLDRNQTKTRTELQTSFNSFAADTQRLPAVAPGHPGREEIQHGPAYPAARIGAGAGPSHGPSPLGYGPGGQA